MTTTDTPSVRVDETLARFRELQGQFERVRDRLRRAEEQKNTVSRRTFDKVRAEYDRELDALRAKMSPLRDELESHRSSVENNLKDANASLDSLEEELAEIVFRHKVGEYSDDEMADKRRVVEARLDSARTRISEQRRTLDMFDEMAKTEAAPAQPEDFADNPASSRSAARPVAHTGEPAPVAPSRAEPAPRDEEHSRRPVLRAKNVDAPAPAEQPAAKAQAKSSDKDFENPHDWIKEMGRDTVSSRRTSPATTPATTPTPKPAPAPTAAARPRLGATPATATASKPAVRGASRTPSLVFVNGAHAGESVPLLPTTMTIGREHDNNIELKDPDVARYHARIVYERGNYVVEDLESTTGTWVNGQRTKKAPLNHGDVVRVGSTEIAIDFEWASDPV